LYSSWRYRRGTGWGTLGPTHHALKVPEDAGVVLEILEVRLDCRRVGRTDPEATLTPRHDLLQGGEALLRSRARRDQASSGEAEDSPLAAFNLDFGSRLDGFEKANQQVQAK
jgi:hypothetical protein